MPKPHNPIDDLRSAASEIETYLGDKGKELLANEFGVTTVSELRPAQLLTAIGLMHETADFYDDVNNAPPTGPYDAPPSDYLPANMGEVTPAFSASAPEGPANDTGH